MISSVTLIGLTAGLCTTFAYVPQVIKTCKTQSTEDISLGMFLIMVIGTILWLIYGILAGDLPVIAANAVTLIFASTILYFKIRVPPKLGLRR